MGQPFSFIADGYYTSNATSQNIALSDEPTFFTVTDTTLWGANSDGSYTAAANVNSSWNQALAAGAYLQIGQAAVTVGDASLYATQGSSGGFTFVDSTNPPTFTKEALTAINDSTFVVSTSATNINVGDTVRLINVAGMQQFSGPTLYGVTAVSSGTSITLGYAASAKTAGMQSVSAGTTGYLQKVYAGQFYPNALPVLYVTQAAQAVVYFARPNPYTPGELVDFSIPTAYGMTQLSNLTGAAGSGALSSNPSGAARVLSVTNSSTVSSITIDVNTTGFTAFTYPATASFALGGSPAFCTPAGSGVVPYNGSATIPQSPPGTNLQDAFDNLNQYYMNLGANVVGASASVMYWQAWKSDYSALTNA